MSHNMLCQIKTEAARLARINVKESRMPGNFSFDQLQQMQGREVYDIEDQKLGSIEHIYYDTDTRIPEWIGLSTGLFGMKQVAVPLDGASLDDRGLKVRYSKDQVKNAPSVGRAELSQPEEEELYQHYGLQYSQRPSASGLPEGTMPGMNPGAQGQHHPRETQGEAPMTRSEEELRVGKRETDAGQVRLRKFVETEPVSAEVDLRRETATVERQQIDRPVEGAQIGEEERVVNLHREEPVVQKDTVAKEEVQISKESEAESETINEEVRKERIVEEGDEQRRRAS
jgi:uncharacterized protein (TIGR02271 family)